MRGKKREKLVKMWDDGFGEGGLGRYGFFFFWCLDWGLYWGFIWLEWVVILGRLYGVGICDFCYYDIFLFLFFFYLKICKVY